MPVPPDRRRGAPEGQTLFADGSPSPTATGNVRGWLAIAADGHKPVGAAKLNRSCAQHMKGAELKLSTRPGSAKDYRHAAHF